MKILAIIFGLLFMLFAAFQYNDPDPEVWIPIYGAAAVACLMAYTGTGRWWFFVGMAILYAVAAVHQWPPAFEGFFFGELKMHSMNIEEARESGGLAICTIVMSLFAWLNRPRPAAARL